MLSEKHTYRKSGWGFIILSVFCVFLFLADYKTQFIFHLTSISELGTILGGTSGIFASLASLFFVLENLEMQRKTISQQQLSIEKQQISIDLQSEELKNQILEMKESNEYFKQQTETLKTQTSESAFFQLLDNHRSLVNSLNFGDENGYPGLTKYYKNLKQNAEKFCQAAFTGDVFKPEFSTFYPLRTLSYQIENVEQLYNNIYHLIKLIRFKLSDSVFYHETFYNSLSKAEKYILGLYVVNEKNEELNIFHNDVFNYLEYFEGCGNGYYNKEKIPFFPNLSFVFIKPWNKFTLEAYHSQKLNTEFGEIEITVLNNEFKFPILLKSTRFEFEWQREEFSFVDDWGLEINEKITINIFSKINAQIFSRFVKNFDKIKKTFPLDISFKVIFVLTYNKRQYNYRKSYYCKSNNIHEEGADMHIEEARY